MTAIALPTEWGEDIAFAPYADAWADDPRRRYDPLTLTTGPAAATADGADGAALSTHAVAARLGVVGNPSKSSLQERLERLGIRVRAETDLERFAPPEDPDARSAHDRHDVSSPEADRVFRSVRGRISEETGMPMSRYVDAQTGMFCLGTEHSTDGDLARQFHEAWRWSEGDTTRWLTRFECAEGMAAFNSPSTHFYSSAEPGRLIPLDLRRPGAPCGPCCDTALDYCGFDLRVYGDRLLITSPEAEGFGVFDADTGATIVKRFGLPRGEILEDAMLLDTDRHALAVQDDGTFSITAFEGGETVLSGAYVDDEVVVWTPDGRFDATAEGAHFVSFRFPGRVGLYVLEQFEDALRVPGLAAAVLAGEHVPAPVDIRPPPTLSARIETRGDALTLTASAAGDRPPRRLDVFQDGLLTDSFEAPAGDETAEWSRTAARLPGTRWVSVVASDASGAASLPIGRDLGPDPAAPRRVHVLAIGIDDFADPRLADLGVAEADARTFAGAIAGAAEAAADMEVASSTLLLGVEATPERILEEARRLAEAAAPGETVAISMSGHGIEDAGAFYFLAPDAEAGDLAGTSLAWADLADALAGAEARVALFVDACHSGMAGRPYFATNDAAATSVLESNPSGLLVVSASKGRQVSWEDDALGNGFFTAALARAVAGDRAATDLDGNGAIEVSELFARIRADVTRQTGDLGLEQTPWLARNAMIGDFALF